MGSQEVLVALLRGVHLAAQLSLFGTLVFATVVAPASAAAGATEATRLRTLLLRLVRTSAMCALLAGAAWLTAATAAIAGTGGVAATLHALPVVALKTQFGQWVLLRLALMLAVPALPLARHWARIAAIALSGAAIAVQ